MKGFDKNGIGLILLLGITSALAIWLLTSCASLKKKPGKNSSSGNDDVEVKRIADLDNLIIERVTFHAAEIQETRYFLALIPKSDKPPEGVFILNHGWSDSPESLLKHLKVDHVYARLLSEHRVRPALVVLPDVRFSNYYRRHSDLFPFPQYLTLVAEEVAKTASVKYHVPFTRDMWGIGGFSFGGYLVLDIARRFSGRFGSVSVVSSFFDTEWLFWPAERPVEKKLDSKGRGKQTIVDAGPIPRILLACGTNDRFYKSMVELHEKFTAMGIAHEWEAAPGGHTWKYWSSVLEKMLEFHLGMNIQEPLPRQKGGKF